MDAPVARAVVLESGLGRFSIVSDLSWTRWYLDSDLVIGLAKCSSWSRPSPAIYAFFLFQNKTINLARLFRKKTKELIVDFRKRQQQPYTPFMISGTPVEKVRSFKYLGVNISEDLTWTTHIQTQVKKARQRLYHLRQLRKFRVSPATMKTFYSGTIESVLTQCISVWYGNDSSQDCKALQDIYLKRCKSRAAKIIKDTNHPGNCLFILLPSGKRFRSMMAKLRDLGGASSPRQSCS